jgi:endogenous inhibitor of DNA gyrase (YacG/DUF329 family)
MLRKCDICGKEYKLARWELKYGKRLYCSKECSKIGLHNKLSGKNKFGGIVTVICEHCGKSFETRRAQINIGTGRFCSRSCVSSHFKGENAHNWKGGAVQGVDFVRKSLEYKKWRQDVFIRDNFTCKKCGDNRGGNLHAHHIKKLSILLQEAKDYLPLFKMEQAAMVYSPIWNIENGETLCELCHQKEHKKHN